MRSVRHLAANRYLHAFLAAVIVGGAVLLYVAARPVEHQGRVSMLASPSARDASDSEFGAVVSLSMPALVELAQSPSLLAKASAEVPGSPPADQLADNITLELVPASGLARLTVRADTAEAAGALATLISAELIRANLLAPAATLRTLDTIPEVTEVKPDSTLALGLALAAAVAAGVAVLALSSLLRPAIGSRLRRALTAAGVERPVALIDSGPEGDVVSELGSLQRASTRPLRLVAVTAALEDEAERLTDVLVSAGVQVGDQEYGDDAPRHLRLRPPSALFVLVVARRVAVGTLSVSISALPEPNDLVAVVVKRAKVVTPALPYQAAPGQQTGSSHQAGSEFRPDQGFQRNPEPQQNFAQVPYPSSHNWYEQTNGTSGTAALNTDPFVAQPQPEVRPEHPSDQTDSDQPRSDLSREPESPGFPEPPRFPDFTAWPELGSVVSEPTSTPEHPEPEQSAPEQSEPERASRDPEAGGAESADTEHADAEHGESANTESADTESGDTESAETEPAETEHRKPERSGAGESESGVDDADQRPRPEPGEAAIAHPGPHAAWRSEG
jgi:capsular polysaccharide biosynthesis protein